MAGTNLVLRRYPPWVEAIELEEIRFIIQDFIDIFLIVVSHVHIFHLSVAALNRLGNHFFSYRIEIQLLRRILWETWIIPSLRSKLCFRDLQNIILFLYLFYLLPHRSFLELQLILCPSVLWVNNIKLYFWDTDYQSSILGCGLIW